MSRHNCAELDAPSPRFAGLMRSCFYLYCLWSTVQQLQVSIRTQVNEAAIAMDTEVGGTSKSKFRHSQLPAVL